MSKKRWDCNINENVEDAAIDAFLAAVIEVCKRHNMSIGHEDGHGAFEISRGFDQGNAEWLMAANVAKEYADV